MDGCGTLALRTVSTGRQRCQQPQAPPQQPPPPPCRPAPGGAPPRHRRRQTAERSLTVSAWPSGQLAGADASAIGRLTSKVLPQARQRNSYRGMPTGYGLRRTGTRTWIGRLFHVGDRRGVTDGRGEAARRPCPSSDRRAIRRHRPEPPPPSIRRRPSTLDNGLGPGEAIRRPASSAGRPGRRRRRASGPVPRRSAPGRAARAVGWSCPAPAVRAGRPDRRRRCRGAAGQRAAGRAARARRPPPSADGVRQHRRPTRAAHRPAHRPAPASRRPRPPARRSGVGIPPPAVGAGQPADVISRAGRSRSPTKTGISATAVQAYGYAELVVGQKTPACQLRWTTLAAIGKVESGHGTANGATLTPERPGVPAHRRPPARRPGRPQRDHRHRRRAARQRPDVRPCGRSDAVHPDHLGQRRGGRGQRRHQGPTRHRRRSPRRS